MTESNYNDLLSRLEASTKSMIAERDCFYDGCAIDDETGLCVIEINRNIMDMLDREITLNKQAIDKAKGNEMKEAITEERFIEYVWM